MAATSNDDPHDDPCGCPHQGSVTRRQLVVGAASVGLSTMGCAGKAQAWDIQNVPTEKGVVSLPVTDFPPLATAGGMVAVHPAGMRKPVMVMRIENDQFRVMSLRCPHLGCTVRWNPEEQRLACPCHGSRFDDNGAVLEGPAKSGLTHFPAHFSEMTVRFRTDGT